MIVSQYFYPENFRINDMACEWVKRGHKVTVLTGIPNYPIGKFFDGYGLKKKRRESWNGVEIIRIPILPRGKHSLGMIANYLSFVVSGFFASKKKIKADVVFTFEVSPMTQALVGCWCAKKRHVPHYLYVQDLWPENVETVTGIHSTIIIRPIHKMVDYIYKNTDMIFATSPSFVDAICNRRVLVSRDKVRYWPQYAEEFYRPMEKEETVIPNDGRFKIIFTGNIGTAQGLDILPKVAEQLKTEKLTFVIVGEGRYQKEFEQEISERKVNDKFLLIPKQPAEEIPRLLACCEVAFLSFQDEELWEKTIPAKLQSYMACGMPIIACAKGETKRIIEEAGCGICCNLGDEEKLVASIKKIMNLDLKEFAKASRAYFEANFDKKKLMDCMEAYLEEYETE